MKPMGGMGDIQKMMKQAQQMQQKLMEVQEGLGSLEVEGSAGGGAVKVQATGKHIIKSVRIQPEALDPEDVETLEDLILAAVNDAINQANLAAQEQMNAVTGGMQIPGMDKLF